MEKERKGYEILDEKISPDNVMRMGEPLALSALKFMCGHKMLHRMYANLARDIDYKDLDGDVLRTVTTLHRKRRCSYADIWENPFSTPVSTRKAKRRMQ